MLSTCNKLKEKYSNGTSIIYTLLMIFIIILINLTIGQYLWNNFLTKAINGINEISKFQFFAIFILFNCFFIR